MMTPLWLRLIYFVVAGTCTGALCIAWVDLCSSGAIFFGPNADQTRVGCIVLGIFGVAMFVAYFLTYGA